MQIVLGGGCFWCIEATLKLLEGVKITPGYSGGSSDTADYYQVSSGQTGHAEVVKAEYKEPEQLQQILKVYFDSHDPTSLNRQGNDVGPQYRSVVFYDTPEQKQAVEQYIAKQQKEYSEPIVTEVKPLEAFYEAEPEHHDYFAKNPNSGYCQFIIKPKLEKIKNEL